MNLEKLCLEIAKVEDGKKVKEILKNYNLWENEDNWVSVGSKIGKVSDLNNHSTIGNQQSNPANALVEKLVNCGDSALLSKCVERGIDPMSNDAPLDVRDAIRQFLGVQRGRWINATPSEKTKLSENYCNLVATGETGRSANPTFTIIDSAEGQHPDAFEETFLSLTLKNKVGVRFVQGKFGMGSYGAVNFCTVDGLQFILSKRNPSLLEPGDKHLWGFTVVRKIAPEGNYKSSRWVYLIIDNKVPSFEGKSLDLFPGPYPNAYGTEFEFGSFIKLYNYDIGSTLRTNILLDLYNKINTLLVNPVVPVRFHERRKFNANSYESTLDGLETRLERDRSGVVASGFPSDFSFNVNQQQFKGRIYAFNKYSDEDKTKLVDVKNYGNGVMFVINGQTNGSLPATFFNTRGLKYENIRSNLLVLIDCSEVTPKYVEQLFQNDRERIYDSTFTDNIKKEIREELAQHEGLKQFQYNWRKNEIETISDKKNFKELFEKLFKANPQLTRHLLKGIRISNPFDSGEHQETEYIANPFPTFFELRNPHPRNNPRTVESGRAPRILFSTDAPNDYLSRAEDPGHFRVFSGEDEITSFDGVKLSGWNGKWHLGLPVSKEEIQHYRIQIQDASRVDPFESEFHLKIIESRERRPTPPKPPSSNKKELPNITEIRKDKFEEFGIDQNDMLIIEESQDDTIGFFLNMDNLYVLDYLKNLSGTEGDLAKEQYKLSMAIVGLVLIENYKNDKSAEEKEVGLNDFVKDYTKKLSPIIMPLIRDVAKIA
jgi:hypothetical protein